MGGVRAGTGEHLQVHAAGPVAFNRKPGMATADKRPGTLASSHCEILLVEDSEADVYITRLALKQTSFPCRLSRACDGVEALRFLRHEGSYGQAPRPDLILLDLNMPRMDGREVLRVLKQDQQLRRIPVVVLTTSRAQEDVERAYDLYANCYIPKPLDYDGLVRVMQMIEAFWLGTATLPEA